MKPAYIAAALLLAVLLLLAQMQKKSTEKYTKPASSCGCGA